MDGTGGGIRLNNPASMVISGDDTLVYVAEKNAHKIRAISLLTGVSSTVCGSTSSIAGDQDGVGNDGRLRYPHGLAITPDGAALIITEAGGNRIRFFDLESRILSTLAGALDSSAGLQDGHGAGALFAGPAGVDVTPDGKVILVADSNNNHLRRLTLSV